MLLPEVKSVCLLPAGADPHHFQPSPKQVTLLNQGHLLIRATRDDLGWPIKTDNNPVFDISASQAHGWLEFGLVRQVLPALARSLIQQYPLHQKKITAHLNSALKTVDHLDSQWRDTLATIKHKGVFMQHPAWQGLLESSGVPIWQVLESHQHGHEHGPRHLEKALRIFKQHPDALLLGSLRHSNRSLEWLNNHRPQPEKIIKLDALGSCNMPWDKLMSDNLKQLRSLL